MENQNYNNPIQPPNQGGFYPQQQLPNGTTVLVLGILSIVICGIGFILGIIGLSLAGKDGKLYADNPNLYSLSSYNNLKAGKTCSIIGIVLSAAVILFYIVYFVIILSVVSHFHNF